MIFFFLFKYFLKEHEKKLEIPCHCSFQEPPFVCVYVCLTPYFKA